MILVICLHTHALIVGNKAFADVFARLAIASRIFPFSTHGVMAVHLPSSRTPISGCILG